MPCFGIVFNAPQIMSLSRPLQLFKRNLFVSILTKPYKTACDPRLPIVLLCRPVLAIQMPVSSFITSLISELLLLLLSLSLSLLIFCIYINDLPLHIPSNSAECHMLADDTTLHTTGKSIVQILKTLQL